MQLHELLAQKKYVQVHNQLMLSGRLAEKQYADLVFLTNPVWYETKYAGVYRLSQPTSCHLDFLVSVFDDHAFMSHFNPNMQRLGKDQLALLIANDNASSVFENRTLHWVAEKKVNSDFVPVGLVSLTDINSLHRRAELMAGFPNHHQYSSHRDSVASTLLAISHAFDLGINKLTSVVLAFNDIAQRSTLALGFTQEAYRKSHFYHIPNGQWVDVYENGLTYEMFNRSQRTQNLYQYLLK